jgi:hypothetical protein
VNVEHFLFFVQTNEERVRATVDVPVHAGRVVTFDVVAIIREFEAGALS